MNRSDVQLLQSVRGAPAVSILLPTHRAYPANQQDPIRVKNLVSEATSRLLAQYKKREIEPLLARLEALAAEIDYRHTLDGLTLFVSRDFALKFYLPFPLHERVVIGDGFATRDLVFALNRSLRYWVLALSENATRLFEGMRESLEEIAEGGFPLAQEGPGATEPLPGGFGIRRSAYRDEYDRQFLRQVDETFGRLTAADVLPLAVVGVERNLALFQEVSRHRNLIIATMTGSHDKTPASELAQLVWPGVREGLARQRQAMLGELEKAVGARQSASGMQAVWRAAQEGRGATLLVERDFHYPARVEAEGLTLTPADDPAAPGVLADAVDDMIETMLAKGGRVVFVENGALEAHRRVALILRYSP